MSEQENTEVAEQPAEEATTEQITEAPQANPLFKTLFEIEEGVEESESQEEDAEVDVPMTLNEAVDNIDQPQERESEKEEVQDTEEKPEEVQEEEPEKSEPKKKKLRKVVDPEVPGDVKPELNLSEPEEEVDEYADSLLPEEREVYDLAKYASKNMGKDYDGYDKKFKEFFEKSKSFLDKRIEEDPHFDPSDDPDYAQFIERNRPKLTQADAKKIEKKMWIEEAKREARKELEPETEELRRKLDKAEKAPVIEKARVNFRSMAQKVVIPEEFQKTLEGGEESISKFADENPLEFQILDGATKRLLNYGDTLTDIFLKTTDLDMGNPVHKELVDWVNAEQDNFIKSGQTEKDGQIFMRRERYYAIPENKRGEYYTWSDDDLLKILALRTQEDVAKAITQQREVLQKSGYVRQAEQPAQKVQAPAQQAPAPQKPPSVNATPRPGNNLETKTKESNNAMLNVLGF